MSELLTIKQILGNYRLLNQGNVVSFGEGLKNGSIEWTRNRPKASFGFNGPTIDQSCKCVDVDKIMYERFMNTTVTVKDMRYETKEGQRQG